MVFKTCSEHTRDWLIDWRADVLTISGLSCRLHVSGFDPHGTQGGYGAGSGGGSAVVGGMGGTWFHGREVHSVEYVGDGALLTASEDGTIKARFTLLGCLSHCVVMHKACSDYCRTVALRKKPVLIPICALHQWLEERADYQASLHCSATLEGERHVQVNPRLLLHLLSPLPLHLLFTSATWRP